MLLVIMSFFLVAFLLKSRQKVQKLIFVCKIALTCFTSFHLEEDEEIPGEKIR